MDAFAPRAELRGAFAFALTAESHAWDASASQLAAIEGEGRRGKEREGEGRGEASEARQVRAAG